MAFSEPGIDKRGLWTEQLMHAVPDGHPLVEADAIHWTDLRSEVFVLPTDGIGPVIANILTSKRGAHGDRANIILQDTSIAIVIRTETLRSEERRVGKGWVRTCSSRSCRMPQHKNKIKNRRYKT